jgi:NADPH-dependent 2,4-dienoyl-CoA reductase/sulfur reductase-like enzyme
MSVVIVGASLAGLRTAEALRARGYGERIVLLGAEESLPYDRPPLSKEYLGADAADGAPLLREESGFAELDLDLRLGARALSLDATIGQIQLADGEALTYEDLVIATGADARSTTFGSGLQGFRTLRTLQDASGLRDELDHRPKVVIIGGGFIGAEVAVAARKRGLDVTLIELLPAPMSAALGTQVGELLARTHLDNGVELRCGQTVESAHGATRVEALTLSDGSRIDADLVVLGLGVIPSTTWLEGSGLTIDNGVACDPTLRALGYEHVYAVGDVARWTHPLFDESMRVEHWTNANEHADIVTTAIMGSEKVADAVPYVWSDQYGKRIQIVGRPRALDQVTVVEDDTDGRHLAVYERAGRVVGMLTIGAPKQMMRGRRAIASGLPASELFASL